MKRFFFLILLWTLLPQEALAQSRLQDSLVLVDLYNATGGANWINRTNWLSANPINTWHGITTNAQGCVTKIHLDSNRLNGRIPNLNLPQLEYLYMSKNKSLTGSVPNFDLPNLKNLYVYNDSLTGTIPNFNLPNLISISLSNNRLTGSIPNFNRMPNLIELALSTNQLSDTIPRFNQMPNLLRISLAVNQLTGKIPNLNLPKLLQLGMQTNQLSDTIPPFDSLPQLRLLYIFNNRLSGKIPISFQNLRYLQTFIYDSNKIDSMPNLSMLPLIVDPLVYARGLKSHYNKLTFAHILPNMVFDTIATFNYAPQDSIFTATTYTRNAGQSLTIDLGIDVGIPSNKYKWFKNGVLYRTINGSNQLTFNSLRLTDAGIYTCQVTNPKAPLLTLYSRKATVNVNCVPLAAPQTKSICQGSSYTLRNGRTYSTSGTYRDTIGCDTIYVINLVVNRRDSIELPKITRCYGADTTPVVTRRVNFYGCDSIRVQRFRWAPALATVRLPIEYDCNLVSSRQDTDKIKNLPGCDSVWKIRTRIAVPKYNIELPLQYRCNPADTLPKIQRLTTRSYGCDSIITQRFILARPYLLDTTIWVCAPRDTATKIQRLRTYLGCDSTVIKRYVLARKDIKRLPDIIVCYARDTNTIRKSFLNRFGCDSTIIQRFRLEQQDTTILTETVCDTLFERTDTIPIRTKTKCEAIQIKHFVFQHCECLAKTAVFNGLIPNDGDAKNDVFLFDNIERFTPNELIITDKRNMLMYQVKNYKNDWSGTNQKGEPLPAGVYNYWFSITNPKTGEKCSRVGVVDIKYIP